MEQVINKILEQTKAEIEDFGNLDKVHILLALSSALLSASDMYLKMEYGIIDDEEE